MSDDAEAPGRIQDGETYEEEEEEARGILDELLSDLPGVVYRCRNDPDWSLLGITRNVEGLTGHPPDDFLPGGSVAYADLIHPDDQERVWDEVQSAVERGRNFRLVYRIVTRDGQERWVLEQGRVQAADPGDPETSILTGYIQDISGPLGRRLADQVEELSAVRDERRALGLLHRISSIANETSSLEAALRDALPVVCGLLGYEVGHAWLVDESHEDGLVSTPVWHFAQDSDLEGFRALTESDDWSVSEGAPGRVARSLEPIWISDAGGDAELLRRAQADSTPIRSGIAFPVVSGEEAVAVIELFTTASRRRDPQHLDLVEQVGIQLGRVAEREHAILRRIDAEERLRQFAEQADAAFVLSTIDGEVLYLSSGFERLSGRDGPVRQSSELAEILHPDDRGWVLDLLSRPDRAPYDIEYRVVRQEDGATRWIRQKAFPILDDDGRTYRVGAWAQDITEEKEHRERLERTTRLLEQTFSSLEEAVLIIGAEGGGREIVEANEAATRMFGYSREELVGSRTEMLHVDREHFERFVARGEPALSKKGVYGASFPLRRKDGTVFEAEQTVRLRDPNRGLAGGAVSVIRDVSEREAAERGRRISEQRFREIAESIQDVFWISSPGKDSLEYLSPAFQEIWGIEPEVVYGDSTAWLDSIHPDDRARVAQLLPVQSQPDGSYDVEYRIVRPSGEVRWIWDRSFQVTDEAGEVVRIVGVAEDITERKELEAQLAQSQKMEAVGRLSGGIAHDFNNILTVIRSQIDLLLMDLDRGSELAVELAMIRDAANRAAKLTRQLLAFSRDQILRPQVVDLGAIIRQMEELLTRTLGEDVRFHVDLDDTTPPVEVDASQLEQVIMNLVVNAREAMPSGGRLLVETRFEELSDDDVVAIPGLEAGPWAVIRVTDTGRGIEPAAMDQIFEPFFTTRRNEGGTGLGLAVSYGIVKQSGGHIQVESELGEGTVFTIRLPPSSGEVAQPIRKPERERTPEALTGSVLVVEDDPSVGRVTKRILERAGFEVELVNHGQAAIDLLEMDGDRFDVLLTDLVLPGRSGREIVEHILASDLELAVAVMSGYDSDSSGTRKRLPGQVFFIQKPFTPTGLMDLMREALEFRDD